MSTNAYFAEDGDAFRPLPLSRGFWARDSIQGRALVGLIGHEIERRHGAPDLMPARLIVDMYRLAPFATLRIESREVARSGRLLLVDATLIADGQAHGRASCQFLRRGDDPPGRVWSTPGWAAPPPEALAPAPDRVRERLPFDWRDAEGGLHRMGPRGMWQRERHDLVAGRAQTPFGRVAVAVDFVSPYAHSGEAGIDYINTDISLYLHRLPIDEWIGFELSQRSGADGIAVGSCRLYDRDGAIGFAGCSALVQRPRG